MRAWMLGGTGLASMVVLAVACSDDPNSETTTSPDASADGSNSDDRSNGPGPDGTIDPPPPAPLDPDIAARASVFLASCLSDDGVNRTLQQLYLEPTTSIFRTRSIYECLAKKTIGCKALTECLGFAYANDGPCDAGCTGTLYQECSQSLRVKVECSVLGLECGPKLYCSRPGTQVCNPATYQDACDNGVPVGCEDEIVVRGPRCSDWGSACEAGRCKGNGGACAGTTIGESSTIVLEGQRCEVGKLVACANNGLATVDCATVGKGFSCFDAPDGGPNATAYCGTGAECSPKSPWTKVAATCEGTSVVFCNGGKVQKLDCTALGFTGCDKGLCVPSFFP